MTTIKYLKNVPFFKKLFGTIIGLFAIAVLLMENIFVGLIALAIGLNLILTEGSEIDLERKMYRKVKSIFGIDFGKWVPCPNFDYIAVFKTKEKQRVNVVTASTAFASDVIVINLFYNTNKHITFYKTDSIQDAFDVAEHFKMAFNIAILDATETEKIWL